jgi:hypothetical protein
MLFLSRIVLELKRLKLTKEEWIKNLPRDPKLQYLKETVDLIKRKSYWINHYFKNELKITYTLVFNVNKENSRKGVLGFEIPEEFLDVVLDDLVKIECNESRVFEVGVVYSIDFKVTCLGGFFNVVLNEVDEVGNDGVILIGSERRLLLGEIVVAVELLFTRAGSFEIGVNVEVLEDGIITDVVWMKPGLFVQTK